MPEPDEILIREMKISDYDDVIRLWDEAKLHYRPLGRDTKNRIQAELELHETEYIVAEHNGRIIGSVLGTHDGRKGWINRLAVLPEYRRQHIGEKLVNEVETRLTKKGIDITACLIESWNEISMGVFEKLGYTSHRDIIYFSKRKNKNT